ncbi:hypothetical protein JW865_07455 [Candidatus Bathyarchaeota archaeon]|nr:hypothetical protein [Candidatus Bathyarchaeota archaeon]
MKSANIKDSKWWVTIGGFRTKKFNDIQKFLSEVSEEIKPCIFQFFDAKNVGGWEHLFMSAVNAVNAFDEGENVSKSIPLETLLYASCNDQISKALEIMGIKKDTRDLALIIFADKQNISEQAFKNVVKIIGKEDDSVLDVYSEKYKRLKTLFNVSDLEIEALGEQSVENLINLIIERGSLLRLKR